MPENWSRIFNRPGSGTAPASGGNNLPPPGSVIMAHVEEDLGEGMYAIRWGGNRLAVASQVALSRGSNLILKAELSPEGKTMLVVQGPALPTVDVGPMIAAGYGPAPRKPPETSSGPAGSQPTADGAAAASTQSMGDSPPPGTSLKPLLEPLPDFVEDAARLLDEIADHQEQQRTERGVGEQAAQRGSRSAPANGETTAASDGSGRQPQPYGSEESPVPPRSDRPSSENTEAAPVRAEAASESPTAKPVPADGRTPLPSGRSPARENATVDVARAQTLQAELSTGKPDSAPVAPDAPPTAPSPSPDNATAESARPMPSVPELSETQPLPESSAGRGTPAADGPRLPPEGTPGHAERVDVSPAPPSGDAAPVLESPAGASPAQPPPGSEPRPEVRPDAPSQAVADGTVKIPVPPPETPPVAPPSGTSPPPVPVSPISREGVSSVAVRDLSPPHPAPAVPTVAEPSPQPNQTSPPPQVQDSGDVRPAPAAQPSFVEALEQIARTVELPLGDGVAAIIEAASGKMPAMPDAVADKAAAILLSAAGLSPGAAALDAAKALIRNNVQIDRSIVQTLLALAAGYEGEERDAVLRAAARLAARDVPLAAPLAGGLAAVLERHAGVMELTQKADAALRGEAFPVEARPLVDSARELLNLLAVDLEASDAHLALERYVSTFGRETLGRVALLIEKAAQSLLENNPQLTRIDQALTTALSLLSGAEPVAETASSSTVAEGSIRVPVPPSETSPSSGEAPPSSVQTPASPQNPTFPDQSGESAPPPAGGKEPPESAPAPSAPDTVSGAVGKAPERAPLPGVNAPEFELLKPGGAIDRYLAGGGEKESAAARRDMVETAVRDLLSDSPEKRELALREMTARDKPFLRELAFRLVEAERGVMRGDSLLGRLSEAASTLRDLGRQLLAVKAENIAGQDRTPGVMLAEVPFKLNADSGEGRMQMFYRKGGSAKGGWSSRVILDLNTTNLGPVLGDMRFFGSDMVLNMFVGNDDTAAYLRNSVDSLTDSLMEKGFRLKARFMILPAPPPIAPSADAPAAVSPDAQDVSTLAGERPKPRLRDHRGRLDTRA